jgi:hypothetical protein
MLRAMKCSLKVQDVFFSRPYHRIDLGPMHPGNTSELKPELDYQKILQLCNLKCEQTEKSKYTVISV